MTRTLSTLMGSGVQLVDALGLVTEMMGNAVVKQAFKRCDRRGQTWNPALEATGRFRGLPTDGLPHDRDRRGNR